MYVLLDMEWLTNEYDATHPTQIAAGRVDEKWVITDKFSSCIKPKDGYNWGGQVAFHGHGKDEFDNAPELGDVINSLCEWLKEDDILCWWTKDSYNRFDKIYAALKGEEFRWGQRILAMQMKDAFADKGIGYKGLYRIADMLDVGTNLVTNCSER